MTPHGERSEKDRDTYSPERYATPQGRRQPIAPRSPGRRYKNYYSDEHPEIPKVRRASLVLSSQIEIEVQAPERSETSAHLPRVTTHMLRTVRSQAEIEEDEWLDYEEDEWLDDEQEDAPAPPPITNKVQVSRRRPSPRYEPEDEFAPSTGKIQVSRRRPSPRYEPEDELASFTDKVQISRRRVAPAYEPAAPSRPRKARVVRGLPEDTASTYRPRGRHFHDTVRPRPFQFSLQLPASLAAFKERLGQRQNMLHVGGVVSILLILLLLLTHLPTPLSPYIISLNLPGLGNPQSNAQPTAVPGNSRQLVIIPPNTDHPSPPVFAQAAYLMDADSGVTLYAANPFTHLPILSTTKLMTALLAAETGNPNQSITINNAIANDIAQLSADSSVMVIKKGETYTLKELLYGLMLVSGNDAAVVIADMLAGNQQKFVEEMNQRASQLGLSDTHFVNPHGLLDNNHYSSARDLAILAKQSLGTSLIHEISGTRTYTIPGNNKHPEHVMENGNQFLWWYPGTNGGKTGWDGAGNFVQVSSVVHNNRHLIGVIIHTVNWWTDMRDLMNWGFDTYNWVSPRLAGNLADIPFNAAWNYFADDKTENTIPTGNNGRYYVYTGYSVSPPVLSYFDGNKGLAAFGYPLGPVKTVSTTRLNQRFERGTIQCDQSNGKWQCTKV
jgi:D-alanyl-D-alanine carboxypeptidase